MLAIVVVSRVMEVRGARFLGPQKKILPEFFLLDIYDILLLHADT